MSSTRRGLAPLVLAGVMIVCLAQLVSSGSDPAARHNQSANAPNAERLVIRYADGAFELISRTPLVKTLPPSVAMPAPLGDVRGSWVEVVDNAADVLYR
ncbi:MAG: hypothetical protein GF341_04550 [candidate division Zixibacteria bacterium]|nr:hypothetical protein [candidate division Zixibacteria bacterium]